MIIFFKAIAYNKRVCDRFFGDQFLFSRTDKRAAQSWDDILCCMFIFKLLFYRIF